MGPVSTLQACVASPVKQPSQCCSAVARASFGTCHQLASGMGGDTSLRTELCATDTPVCVLASKCVRHDAPLKCKCTCAGVGVGRRVLAARGRGRDVGAVQGHGGLLRAHLAGGGLPRLLQGAARSSRCICISQSLCHVKGDRSLPAAWSTTAMVATGGCHCCAAEKASQSDSFLWMLVLSWADCQASKCLHTVAAAVHTDPAGPVPSSFVISIHGGDISTCRRRTVCGLVTKTMAQYPT